MSERDEDRELVERVARAICRARGRDPDMCVMGSGGLGTDGFAFSECYRRAWQDECAAAVAALSELRKSPPRDLPVVRFKDGDGV